MMLTKSQTDIPLHAPKWIPDEEVHECMQCSTPFSLWVRRHHCRACGGVFCNTCTANKRLLLHLGYNQGLERVCGSCTEALQVDANTVLAASTAPHAGLPWLHQSAAQPPAQLQSDQARFEVEVQREVAFQQQVKAEAQRRLQQDHMQTYASVNGLAPRHQIVDAIGVPSQSSTTHAYHSVQPHKRSTLTRSPSPTRRRRHRGPDEHRQHHQTHDRDNQQHRHQHQSQSHLARARVHTFDDAARTHHGENAIHRRDIFQADAHHAPVPQRSITPPQVRRLDRKHARQREQLHATQSAAHHTSDPHHAQPTAQLNFYDVPSGGDCPRYNQRYAHAHRESSDMW